MKYSALVCTRNEEKDIVGCVNSILNQSNPPIRLVVIDDGSSDNTPKILETIKARLDNSKNMDLFQFDIDNLQDPEIIPQMVIKTRKDRGYSALGTYLMADVYNCGFRIINKYDDWDFIFIGSSDNHYPRDYIKKLSIKMEGYGVASGVATDAKLSSTHPAGSGRLIRKEVMKSLGWYYPRSWDWEGATERMSWHMGLKITNFPEIKFIRTRKQDQYHKRNHKGWGFAMRESGYHPLVVLARCIKMIIKTQKFGMTFSLLVGYFAFRPKEIPVYKTTIYQMHKQRILFKMRKIMKMLRLYNKNDIRRMSEIRRYYK